MVLGSILGIDVTMAAGGGKDDPVQHGLSTWPQWQHDFRTPTLPQVAAQTQGICMALYGNRSHGQLTAAQTLATVGPRNQT